MSDQTADRVKEVLRPDVHNVSTAIIATGVSGFLIGGWPFEFLPYIITWTSRGFWEYLDPVEWVGLVLNLAFWYVLAGMFFYIVDVEEIRANKGGDTK